VGVRPRARHLVRLAVVVALVGFFRPDIAVIASRQSSRRSRAGGVTFLAPPSASAVSTLQHRKGQPCRNALACDGTMAVGHGLRRVHQHPDRDTVIAHDRRADPHRHAAAGPPAHRPASCPFIRIPSSRMAAEDLKALVSFLMSVPPVKRANYPAPAVPLFDSAFTLPCRRAGGFRAPRAPPPSRPSAGVAARRVHLVAAGTRTAVNATSPRNHDRWPPTTSGSSRATERGPEIRRCRTHAPVLTRGIAVDGGGDR